MVKLYVHVFCITVIICVVYSTATTTDSVTSLPDEDKDSYKELARGFDDVFNEEILNLVRDEVTRFNDLGDDVYEQ